MVTAPHCPASKIEDRLIKIAFVTDTGSGEPNGSAPWTYKRQVANGTNDSVTEVSKDWHEAEPGRPVHAVYEDAEGKSGPHVLDVRCIL